MQADGVKKATYNRPCSNLSKWAEIQLEPRGSEMPEKGAISLIQAVVKKMGREMIPIDSVHFEKLPR